MIRSWEGQRERTRAMSLIGFIYGESIELLLSRGSYVAKKNKRQDSKIFQISFVLTQKYYNVQIS